MCADIALLIMLMFVRICVIESELMADERVILKEREKKE
jgi:hypothetical protein